MPAIRHNGHIKVATLLRCEVNRLATLEPMLILLIIGLSIFVDLSPLLWAECFTSGSILAAIHATGIVLFLLEYMLIDIKLYLSARMLSDLFMERGVMRQVSLFHVFFNVSLQMLLLFPGLIVLMSKGRLSLELISLCGFTLMGAILFSAFLTQLVVANVFTVYVDDFGFATLLSMALCIAGLGAVLALTIVIGARFATDLSQYLIIFSIIGWLSALAATEGFMRNSVRLRRRPQTQTT